MNKRNACFAGLTVVVTLLAGCAAQIRNTNACEEEMRNRLADQTLGELKVTHSATTYRGARVVIEGQLDHVPAAAAGASAAKAAEAAQPASAAAHESSGTAGSAAQGSQSTAPSAVAAMVPGMMAVPTAPAATGAGAAPTTPLAELAVKLGLRKTPLTSAAAECTFNESGLVTFRWLAPPALAKTTPDPNAGND
jgi:hypothetical protein